MRSCLLASFVLAFAGTVSAQIQNGDFEFPLQAGSPPFAPWVNTHGSNEVAPPSTLPGAFSDAGFPTSGVQWLWVTSEGTGPANSVAPSNPAMGVHAAGTVSEVRQQFVAGNTGTISFDWTFITGEFVPTVTYHDFGSIDIVDPVSGTVVHNLLFVDDGAVGPTNIPGATGAPSGPVSWVTSSSPLGSFEVGPAGPKLAVVPVPGLIPGNTYELIIVAANFGDGSVQSFLYLDNFLPSVAPPPPVNQLNTGNAALRFSGGGCQGPGQYPLQTYVNAGGSTAMTIATPLNGQQPYALFLTVGVGTTGMPGLPTPYGLLDLDPMALTLAPAGPLTPLINGIAPATLLDQFLGDTGITGTRTIDFSLPPGGSGTLGTFQAICADPTSPQGLQLTAATQVDFSPVPPLGGSFTGTIDTMAGANTTFQLNFSTGFSFPFYGTTHSSCFINSNGNITFTSGDTNGFADVWQMTNGFPRIAPLWDDFDASVAGTVAYTEIASSLVVSWTGITEAFEATSSDMAVVLDPSGLITMVWGPMGSSDGITGITSGGLIAPAPGISRDLSQIAGTFVGMPNEALFEQFNEGQFDLNYCLPSGPGATLTFVPNTPILVPGDNGYAPF